MKVISEFVGPCPFCGTKDKMVNPNWLKEKRKSAKLLLKDIAKRLNFSIAYISDIENGRNACSFKIREFYESL